MSAVALIESQFLDAKSKGDTSGNWIAESKYRFNVAPNERGGNDVLLQVLAVLSMDFANGGEIEYICELIYRFVEFDFQKSYGQLIETAWNCNRDLEQLFDRENIINRGSGLTVWGQWDYDIVKKMVDENVSSLNL